MSGELPQSLLLNILSIMRGGGGGRRSSILPVPPARWLDGRRRRAALADIAGRRLNRFLGMYLNFWDYSITSYLVG